MGHTEFDCKWISDLLGLHFRLNECSVIAEKLSFSNRTCNCPPVILRCLIRVLATLEQCSLLLINTYAPKQGRKRTCFFRILADLLQTVDNETDLLILGGNINEVSQKGLKGMAQSFIHPLLDSCRPHYRQQTYPVCDGTSMLACGSILG